MPRINLLPWREQQRTDRKKAFGVGLGVAALAAAALAGLAYVFFNQMIAAQQTRNALLREEIKTVDKQIEQINSLEQQKQQMVARMQIIEKLQQSRPEIVHIYDTLTKLVPDGVYLTAITQTDQKFKIQGITQSATRVSTFMDSLDASEWLKMDDPGVELEEKPLGLEFIVSAHQRTSTAEDAHATQAKAQRKKP